MTDVLNVTGAVTPELVDALNTNFRKIDEKLDTLDELSAARSTTSVEIGKGIKEFTVDKDFAAGSWVLAASDADPSGNQMIGKVVSCIDGVLTVEMQAAEGIGAICADWTIRATGAISEGPPGPQGLPGNTYPNTTIGIDKTTDGDLFQVQASGDTFATLYKNVSGVAVLQQDESGSVRALANKTFTDKILRNLEGRQTIGRPYGVACIDGTVFANNVYAHMQPVDHDGYILGWRYFGKGTGTGHIRIGTVVGTTATILREFPVDIVPEAQDDPLEIQVFAGESVFLHAPGLVSYSTSGYPDEMGFWRLTGNVGVGSSGTVTPITAIGTRLQISFDIGYQKVTAADTKSSISALRGGAELIQDICRPRSAPLVTGSASSSLTYVRADLVRYPSRLKRLRYNAVGVGTIYFGVFIISGSNKTTFRWYPIQTQLGEHAVDFDLDGDLVVLYMPGQAVGYYPAGVIATTSGADGAGYWSASGRVASFDSDTIFTASRHQISFELASILPAGGVVRNQFLEGNDPENASSRALVGTSIVDITHPDLNKLGIYKGVKGNASVNYGSELERRTVGGEEIFVRGYFITNTPGEYGIPRLLMSTDDVELSQVRIKVETQFDSNTAAFAGSITNFAVGAIRYAIACEVSGGVEVTVGGLQFGIGNKGQPVWIEPGDYATDIDQSLPAPIMGGDLWLLDNKQPKFFFENIIPWDEPDTRFIGSLSFPRPDAEEAYEVATESRGGQRLDPTKIVDGSTADLLLYLPERNRSRPWRKSIACHVKAGSGLTGVPVINGMGDSGFNRRLYTIIDAKAAKTGLAPVWVGTIKGTNLNGSANVNGTGGVLGEARESWRFSEVIGKDLTRSASPKPLPAGQEANYLAMNKANKRLWNPYLKRVTGTPDPTKDFLYDGYYWTFDYGHYITRFLGLTNGIDHHVIAGITHVVVPFGGNDGTYDADSAEENISIGVPIVCNSILAYDAAIKIALGGGVRAFSRPGRSNRRVSMLVLKAIIDAVEAFNHPNVKIVSRHAHMSPYADFQKDASNNITDWRHLWGSPQQQSADPLTAWLANTL